MCDASERQLEQLLVAPAWKTQHQGKAMGLCMLCEGHICTCGSIHVVGSSKRVPAPTDSGTKRLWGWLLCSKGQAGSLWAGKQLVMRNKTSKAHCGTNLAQILFRNSPLVLPVQLRAMPNLLLPLPDPQLHTRKLRVGKQHL